MIFTHITDILIINYFRPAAKTNPIYDVNNENNDEYIFE